MVKFKATHGRHQNTSITYFETRIWLEEIVLWLLFRELRLIDYLEAYGTWIL